MLAVVGASLLVAAIPATATAGTTETWSGATPASTSGAANWSQSSNWVSGTPPTGTDSLAFPTLTCTSTTACRTSDNDSSGLSPGAITIDAGAGYTIGGNSITLGSGGLTAPRVASPTGTGNQFTLPIALGANQTWSFDGNAGTSHPGASMSFLGTVTGPTDTLRMSLADRASVILAATTDVGALTLSGASSSQTGSQTFQNGSVTLSDGTNLNTTSGNPVSLVDLGLFATGATIGGPFTETGANIQVGTGGPGPASGQTLTFDGNATMDGGSVYDTFVQPHSGGGAPVAGTDDGEILSGPSATSKTLDLHGAQLHLLEGNASCSELHPGDVYTLVHWDGTLTGTFAGLPGGAATKAACAGPAGQSLRIGYTPHDVTATVVAASTTSLSSSSATPTAGQAFTLTASVSPASGSGPAPTGAATFTDGSSGAVICDHVALRPSSGSTSTASCSTASPVTGSHAYVASYGGDAGYGSSAQSASVSVQAPPSGGGGGATTPTATKTTTTTPPAAVSRAQILAALQAALADFSAQLATLSTQGLAHHTSVLYTALVLTPGVYRITITFLPQGRASRSAVKRMTLGSATLTATRPGKLKIRIKFSRASRSALRQAAKARMTISATFTPGGGVPQKAQSTITLRALATGTHSK